MKNAELEKELIALAEKYKGDLLGNGSIVACILYTILGCLNMNSDALLALAQLCVEFSKSMLSQIKYNEWIEKG